MEGRPIWGGPPCSSSIFSGGRRHRQHSAWVSAASHCHRHEVYRDCSHAVTFTLSPLIIAEIAVTSMDDAIQYHDGEDRGQVHVRVPEKRARPLFGFIEPQAYCEVDQPAT